MNGARLLIVLLSGLYCLTPLLSQGAAMDMVPSDDLQALIDRLVEQFTDQEDGGAKVAIEDPVCGGATSAYRCRDGFADRLIIALENVVSAKPGLQLVPKESESRDIFRILPSCSLPDRNKVEITLTFVGSDTYTTFSEVHAFADRPPDFFYPKIEAILQQTIDTLAGDIDDWTKTSKLANSGRISLAVKSFGGPYGEKKNASGKCSSPLAKSLATSLESRLASNEDITIVTRKARDEQSRSIGGFIIGGVRKKVAVSAYIEGWLRYLEGHDRMQLAVSMVTPGGDILWQRDLLLPAGLIGRQDLALDADCQKLEQFDGGEVHPFQAIRVHVNHDETDPTYIGCECTDPRDRKRYCEEIELFVDLDRPLYLYVYAVDINNNLTLLYPLAPGDADNPVGPTRAGNSFQVRSYIKGRESAWYAYGPDYGKERIMVYALPQRVKLPGTGGGLARLSGYFQQKADLLGISLYTDTIILTSVRPNRGCPSAGR